MMSWITAVQATRIAVIAASNTSHCRFGEGLLDLCWEALILCTANLHEVAARDPDALGGAGSFVLSGKVRP
jgi:hypothetical protein